MKPGGFDGLTGDIIVHTTDDFRSLLMGDANVIWTSNVNGVANITGEAWMLRDIGRGNERSLT